MNKGTNFTEICDFGLVCDVDGMFALVELEQNNSCIGCGFFHKCSIKSPLSSRKIWVENKIGAKIGDNVKLSISPPQYITGAALLFLLPIAILILGYFFLFYIGLSQTVAVFVAIFLSALAIPVIRFFEKKTFSRRLYCAVETIKKQNEHS